MLLGRTVGQEHKEDEEHEEEEEKEEGEDKEKSGEGEKDTGGEQASGKDNLDASAKKGEAVDMRTRMKRKPLEREIRLRNN